MLCVIAATASPAAAAVPNACQYNYDSYYRDTPFTVTGTPSIVAEPPRYPAPTGTQADPGQQIHLDGAPVDVSLPDNLPKFAYLSGLIGPGVNTIHAKVWVAIAATNTLERVQVLGPYDVTAHTTIETVDPTDPTYVSDDGMNIDALPVLDDTTWTAVGGDVVFSQAGPGSLGVKPVGPIVGGVHADRTIAGSILVHADVGTGTAVSFYMDCQPGAVNNPAPTDLAGPTFTPASPAPFDSTITGPRNVACLSAQGRLASGAAAQLPTGPPPPEPNREIDPIGLTLAASTPAGATTGAPYALTGATAHVTLSAGTVATLANFSDGGTPLIVADKPYPLDLWVAIAGSNTAQGVQTVHVQGTYALHPAGGGNWNAYEATIALPPTTWTASAAGPVRFSLAAPGSMSSISVTGSAANDPLAGGTAPYSVAPYGSAVLRAGTEVNPATLDCLPGYVRITNALVPFSNLGRTGSTGRYTVTAHPSPPAFATATATDPTTPPPPPPPPPAPPPPPPPVVPPPVAPPPPPPPPPPAVVTTVKPGRIDSSSLRVRAARIGLRIFCSDSKVSCGGIVSVRSALKIVVGKTRKIVTIAPDTRYTVAAGKRKTLTLKVGTQARSVLRKRKTLRVKITLKPARGAAVTRTVTLR